MDELTELARRAKTQAPPPWVVWEALCDPWRPGGREWFDVRSDELTPAVLQDEQPALVVWSSIWKDRPQLRIRFDLEQCGAGSLLTWTLLGPKDFDDADVKRRRYRLNQLINGQLRESFDQ